MNFSNKIKLDDLILIKNPLKPRPYWQLGRVVELFPGNDNKIRSVWVKRCDGMTQTYSIKHLYPWELSLTHDYQPLTPELEETEKDTPPNSTINVPATKDTSVSNAVPRKRSTRWKKKKKTRKNRSNDPYLYYQGSKKKNERTQNARYAEKKIQIKITGNLQRNIITYFEQL